MQIKSLCDADCDITRTGNGKKGCFKRMSSFWMFTVYNAILLIKF